MANRPFAWRWALPLALVLLLSTASASAYSVSTHEKLTARASELLARCPKYGVPLAAPDAETTHILQYYNARQDDPLNKTGLWHFPKVAQREETTTRAGTTPSAIPSRTRWRASAGV